MYEFTKRRVILAKDGLPNKEVWLIIRRTIGDAPVYSFYISNAGRSTRLATFVWLSGIRWTIEQCFEECKSDLGMDHYKVRRFGGWNHHILTCILAHFFLWHLKPFHDVPETDRQEYFSHRDQQCQRGILIRC